LGGTVQLALRLPEDLRDRIKQAADEAGQSMNSAIVASLEGAYPPPRPDIDRDTLEKWAREIRRIEDQGAQQTRLEEVNKTLTDNPDWQGWKLELASMRREDGTVEHGVVIWPPPESWRSGFVE
jgi:hypothetical protein